MNGNLLIAHGGGPTAVINASLYGVITEAEKHPKIQNVIGARFGIEGVFKEDFIDLRKESRAMIDLLPYTPSSILGSCRRKLTEEDYQILLEIFKRNNIRYFFYNGGNDSMDTCNKVDQLARASGYEMRVIGIPKTIDNDLLHTDHCPGFGSAARFVATTARDLSRELQAMPLYVTILETMGRNAGWLAASAALARTGDNDQYPSLIYLPEIPFSKDQFLRSIEHLVGTSSPGVLVVVSEGIVDSQGQMLANLGIKDGFGHSVPGGVGQFLANLVTNELGLNARADKPGFVGRASYTLQSTVDRDEAIAVGRHAVRTAVEGETGYMVSIVRSSTVPYRSDLDLVSLNEVANFERKMPRSWINDEGSDVTDEFVEYCRPLLGEALPRYAEFDYVPFKTER